MKFLIDTNIFIPLEPTGEADIEPGTGSAADFVRRAQEAGCTVFVHPASLVDVARDRSEARRGLRNILFTKYPALPEPPEVLEKHRDVLGQPERGSNDWVDNQIIAAVVADAVDWLVTEDHGLHRKAVRLGVGDRVLHVAEALAVLADLFGDTLPEPPPSVRALKAHNLNLDDPIFASLREDYEGFGEWMTKCRRDHRQTWIVDAKGAYAGVCIVKDERPPEHGLSGKTLKLCTFKISKEFAGFRFGELLLKAIFHFTHQNRFDWMYVTILPRHVELIDFLADFGFRKLASTTALGEVVMSKPMTASPADEALPALDYHLRFGPYRLRLDGVPTFAVPIQPQYHTLLFPDAEEQVDFTAGFFPAGNGIRKAYLCHAPTREVKAGNNIVFYRSGGGKKFTVLAVVEDALVSRNAEQIARLVGKRTVYRFDEIRALCASNREVLVLLFRQSRILARQVVLEDAIRAGVLSSHPQSITKLPNKAGAWLATAIGT